MFELINQLDDIYDLTRRKLLEAEDTEEQIPQTDEKAAYGVYDISFNMWQEFQDALAKVNKKAEKYGVRPLSIKSKEKVNLAKEGKPPMPAWRVSLEGEPVRIKGWDFLASLEHSGGASNVIRFVPGREDVRVRDFAKASNRNCDFCHSNRDRNNTYIVRNVETGELKQVGGQCLQKYIGDTARKLAKFAFRMASIIDELMDDDGEGGGGERSRRGQDSTDARTALAASFTVIKAHGYISRAMAEQRNLPSTLDYVKCGLFGFCAFSKDWMRDNVDFIESVRNPSQEALKQADDLIEWFNNMPDDKKETSYMISVASIIDADMVTLRSLGLIASLPATYHRYLNGVRERANEKPSTHMGTVGAKIAPTKAKCVHAQYHDGDFGRYQIVKFVDDAGNVYTWFNSGRTELEKGATYEIVGTVKRHDEYQGKKQTTLSRVKAKMLEPAPSEAPEGQQKQSKEQP